VRINAFHFPYVSNKTMQFPTFHICIMSRTVVILAIGSLGLSIIIIIIIINNYFLTEGLKIIYTFLHRY